MLKNAMKKIISLIVTALIIMSFAFCVNATGNAVIYATDVKAKSNDTVKVEIILDFNPGINTLRLFLDYSSEYFELTSSTDGGILGQYTHSKDLSAKPYVLYWTNSSKDDFTKNGVLATLEFKVKQGTPSGAYPLNLYFKSANDCINSKLSSVTVELDNGIITVENENDLSSSSSNQTVTSSLSSNLQSQPIAESKPNTVSDTALAPQSTQSKTEQSQGAQSTTESLSSNIISDEGENINSESSVTSDSQPVQDKPNNVLLVVLIAVAVSIATAAIFILLRVKKKST